MTRARALLALSLVTSGAMLGGLSLSGYYEPRPPQSAVVAPIAASTANVGPHLAPQGRLRFVAIAGDKSAPAPAPKPKAAAKAPAPLPKPKVETKERTEPKPKRPQQAAAPWPWNLFSN
ncbi:MAG: hypothetical protein ACAH24_10780 [Hyphomicrobiaceae bacterium]|jgi:hypothetical protein